MLKISELTHQCRRALARKIPAYRGIPVAFGTLSVIYAAATVLSAQSTPFFREDFDGPLQPGWQWMDPRGDCTRSLDARQGYLRILIPEGARHDLYGVVDDYSAPRLVRQAEGDFILETKLTGPTHPQGGLLVWKDYRNDIRLDRGVHFKNEVFFAAAVNGKFLRRAMDYVAGDPTWLRLERKGTSYTAFYSLDGKQWHPISRTYTNSGIVETETNEKWLESLKEDHFHFQPVTGSVEMAAEGPLQVGVSALTKGRERIIDYDYFEIRGK